MNRPEVTIENYGAIYPYYKEIEPNERARAVLHAVLDKVYDPRVHFEDGARERAKELTRDGIPGVMASSHRYIDDQCPIEVGMHRDEALRPLVDDAFILSKPSYFHNPFMRRVIDSLGAVPAFRGKDVGDNYALLQEAGDALLDTCVQRILGGESTLLFFEGERNGTRLLLTELGKKVVKATEVLAAERNIRQAIKIVREPRAKKDPTVLAKAKKGVGRIACGVETEGGKVFILPMALWQGTGARAVGRHFSPDIYVGMPLEGPFESPYKVTKQLDKAARFCLAMAIEKSQEYNE